MSNQRLPASGMQSPARPFLLLLLAISYLCAPVAAQNALSNPELDPPFFSLGWRLFFGENLDWTSEDGNGCAGSGSGQLTSAPTDTGWQSGVASQCVTTHPEQWPWGYFAEFDYDSGGASMAYIVIFAYSDTLSGWGGGNYLGSDYSEGPTGPGWHHVTMQRPAIPVRSSGLEVSIAAEGGDGWCWRSCSTAPTSAACRGSSRTISTPPGRPAAGRRPCPDGKCEAESRSRSVLDW